LVVVTFAAAVAARVHAALIFGDFVHKSLYFTERIIGNFDD
jgi:hypothetical protein